MHGYGLYLNVLISLTTSSFLSRYADTESQHNKFFYRISFLLITFVLCFQIGPPNPTFLKTTDKSTWTAKDVADSVLSDKSALVTFWN